MPNGKRQHDIVRFLIAIQYEAACPAARHDEIPHIVLGGTTDQGVVPENLHCLADQFSRLHGRYGGCFEQEIHQPIEIGESFPGIDQPRQALAFGLAVILPRARERRYA